MGRSLGVVQSAAAAIAYNLRYSSSWWHDINDSPLWQDQIFRGLAMLYHLVAVVALVQLLLLHLRVPYYGWTTQKVFQFLNFVVNTFRFVVFVYRRQVQNLHSEILLHVLLDLPSLGFLTTYAILVLFWAEIYYKARNESTHGLRLSFYAINAAVYLVQIIIWLIMWRNPIPVVVLSSKLFFAGVSLFAAVGFVMYGGRLFLMLKRFPVESRGRRKKLREVGYVTAICFTCFVVRCVMMGFCAFDKAADLDVLNHPVLSLVYYLLVEIFPSSLVLFILRKLPRRNSAMIPQFQPLLASSGPEESNQG
ncbi:hypothetical protein ACLB2K_022828 [Fragaria x ananassa]